MRKRAAKAPPRFLPRAHWADATGVAGLGPGQMAAPAGETRGPAQAQESARTLAKRSANDCPDSRWDSDVSQRGEQLCGAHAGIAADLGPALVPAGHDERL
jgi:hypothetical protein